MRLRHTDSLHPTGAQSTHFSRDRLRRGGPSSAPQPLLQVANQGSGVACTSTLRLLSHNPGYELTRPKIGGLEVLLSLTLVDANQEHPAFLLEGGHIATPREGSVDLISLRDDVDHIKVEGRGFIVHPGPTGCLGGLFAGAVNIAMSKLGIGQGTIRVALRAGGDRTFRLAPELVPTLRKVFKTLGITVDT